MEGLYMRWEADESLDDAFRNDRYTQAAVLGFEVLLDAAAAVRALEEPSVC